MKKISIACLAFAASVFSAAAFGAAGEYWEITSKMEMKGMPFAMPATTVKVCMPPGGEKDPRRTQDKKSNCEMTDVKTSGNKVSYKGKCVEKDGTMNMEGESTHERDSYHGTMHMTGKSQGDDIDMKTTYSGKRIGGSCDTEELVKKAQAQAQEQKQQAEKIQKDALTKACDVSDPNKLLTSAAYYAGSSPMCSNKKEYCNAVREKAQRDTGFFRDMASQEKMRKKYASQGMKKTEEVSVINICSLDMASLGKAVCKNSVHRGPQNFLDENCSPAEAKEYREFARKQQDMVAKEDESCEGRGFTSDEMLKTCKDMEAEDRAAGNSSKEKQLATSKKADSKQNEPGIGGVNPDTVLQGAKKLKGMFGF